MTPRSLASARSLCRPVAPLRTAPRRLRDSAVCRLSVARHMPPTPPFSRPSAGRPVLQMDRREHLLYVQRPRPPGDGLRWPIRAVARLGVTARIVGQARPCHSWAPRPTAIEAAGECRPSRDGGAGTGELRRWRVVCFGGCGIGLVQSMAQSSWDGRCQSPRGHPMLMVGRTLAAGARPSTTRASVASRASCVTTQMR